MNISTHINTLARILSVILATLLTKWGLSEDDATAAAVAIIGILTCVVVHFWAIYSQKRLLETPPPEPDQAERQRSGMPPLGVVAVLLLPLGLLAPGCATQADVVATREGLVSLAQPSIDENVAMARELQALGKRTANDVKIREDTKSAFDRFVAESRAQDATVIGRP